MRIFFLIIYITLLNNGLHVKGSIAKNRFTDFVSKTHSYQYPVFFNGSRLNTFLPVKSGYVFMNDSLSDTLLHQKAASIVLFGHKDGFKSSIYCIGNLAVTNKFIILFYLITGEKPGYKSKEVTLVSYDTTGKVYSLFNFSKLIETPELFYFKSGMFDSSKKITTCDISRGSKVENTLYDKDVILSREKFIFNNGYFSSVSDNKTTVGGVTLYADNKSISLPAFKKFICDFPELDLPMKLDTQYLKGDMMYVEMDSFAYNTYPFLRGLAGYNNLPTTNYRLYYIGKKVLKNAYFCLYLVKYNIGIDRLYEVNFATFNKKGVLLGTNQVGFVSLDANDSSFTTSYLGNGLDIIINKHHDLQTHIKVLDDGKWDILSDGFEKK